MKFSKRCFFFCIFGLVIYSFGQENFREAIDSGDLVTAKKMVKNGEIEEIYCGKLSPSDAVSVYEKIFKSMPQESFAACPLQFSYGYGSKVCSNGKTLNACDEVISYLLMEATAGNANSINELDKVVKVALKTRAFGKPIKEKVDTTLWMPCPKKGKDRDFCKLQCESQADSLNDSLRKNTCETKPEHFIETTITVTKPSPLYEKIRTGLLEGFWKSPMTLAGEFANLIQNHSKNLGIPDSLIPNLGFVKNWGEKHKADSLALPGGELFRFCTAWSSSVDSILTLLEIETRCPIFEFFTDNRDGKVYKVKEIAGIDWFVQNLDFDVEENSLCYDGYEENCKTYGRLYSQDIAKGVCPEGAHLSTDEEWKKLEEYAGGASEAALKLRSNGSDDFAFTATFAGYANKNHISTIQGEGAYFWTEKADGDSRGIARSIFSTDKEVSSISVDKNFYLSVRCVKNKE